MFDLVCFRINFLFYDIPLIYHSNKLRSSIICCLFSEDIYIFVGISIEFSSVCESVSELVSDAFVLILLVILYYESNQQFLQLFFSIALFEAVLSASLEDYLA